MTKREYKYHYPTEGQKWQRLFNRSIKAFNRIKRASEKVKPIRHVYIDRPIDLPTLPNCFKN